MNPRRGRLAPFVMMLIVPAGGTIGHAHPAAPPAGLQAEEQDQVKEVPRSEPAADGPARIRGKTIDEWLAALKDRDPATRKWAVEVSAPPIQF
jgi:hypothetical protein